jgi:RNA polymerase sigma factor (sigma-70 family)
VQTATLKNMLDHLRRHAGAEAMKDLSDTELLEQFCGRREEAAFALLVQRHGPAVFGVCRRVLGDVHAAEDAFQTTFLVLVRKAGCVRKRHSLGSFLYGVAYRTAARARVQTAVRRSRERAAVTATSHPDALDALSRAEACAVLHEEMAHLPNKYRRPLVLCYLEGKTHEQAAHEMAWPKSSVASRLKRGCELLGQRLSRRGVVLSAGVLAVLLADQTARAVPAVLTLATVRLAAQALAGNATAGTVVGGVLTGVSATRRAALLGLLVTFGLVVAGVGVLGSQQQEPKADPPPPVGRPTEQPPDEKPRKKVEHNGPISPGIQALATASTDIIIADVVDTNPTKAMEGARDTVKLKVVKTLLGRPAPGETLGVYYHLVWTDEKAETLERVKFEKGQRYVVFLKSHIGDRGAEGKRVAYELTDPWLAVLQDRQWLVREIAAAVRVPHGDARGEWSEAVGPLHARLVAYRDKPSNGTPIITLYLDVRNGAAGDNTKEFNLDKAVVTWKVTGANGKEIAPTSPPGNWRQTPPKKLVLEARQSGRLQVSISGAGIAKDRGGHLELGLDRVWVFDKGDDKAYYLSGDVTIKPFAENGVPVGDGVWSGTLNLPKVKLPIEPE